MNVGVAYCHSVEERCTLDLDSGTYYYQAGAVSKGNGKVCVYTLIISCKAVCLAFIQCMFILKTMTLFQTVWLIPLNHNIITFVYK